MLRVLENHSELEVFNERFCYMLVPSFPKSSWKVTKTNAVL